jgi:predicted GNAT family acetyltransferase
MNIKLLASNDWEKLRDIRLAALQTDPQAFAGSFAGEQQRKEPEWRKRLEDTDRIYFTAEENGAFISLAGAKKESGDVWMLVAVHTIPAARGRGLSQAVVATVLNELKKRSVTKVELMVNTDQKDAVHIYEKAGFKITKTLTGEKLGDGKIHDEYVMEMKLN